MISLKKLISFINPQKESGFFRPLDILHNPARSKGTTSGTPNRASQSEGYLLTKKRERVDYQTKAREVVYYYANRKTSEEVEFTLLTQLYGVNEVVEKLLK